MQQDDVARCVALLDGISSFDSTHEETRTSLLDASPAKQPVHPAAHHAMSAASALDASPAKQTSDPAAHQAISTASLRTWVSQQARQASKLESKLTLQQGTDMPGGPLQALQMKLGADAFLPGPGGVTMDVRTLRIEPDFSPFAAGISG